MFITAVCFIFLIKLRWPKTKSLYYVYPFQNLNLGFILKIFLIFRKFQPQYSYKIYSYKKKRVLCSENCVYTLLSCNEIGW